MADLPPLHPDRIVTSLANLLEARSRITDATLETCRVALYQIQRAHRAIGITSEVADLGTGLIKAAGAFSSLVRKRL